MGLTIQKNEKSYFINYPKIYLEAWIWVFYFLCATKYFLQEPRKGFIEQGVTKSNE